MHKRLYIFNNTIFVIPIFSFLITYAKTYEKKLIGYLCESKLIILKKYVHFKIIGWR